MKHGGLINACHRLIVEGGYGSGNFGHAGRPGEVGGSALGKGGSALRSTAGFYDAIVKDFTVSNSAIKKVARYTSDWRSVEFTPTEIAWLKSLPIPALPENRIIYRGMFIKEDAEKYSKGKEVEYEPKGSFSSWTTNKKDVDYFQRGRGIAVMLKAQVPKDHFNVSGFFKLVNKLDDRLSRLNKQPTRQDEKVMDLLDRVRLFNEGEVWVFGKHKAKVVEGW